MRSDNQSIWIKGEREAAAYCRMALATWKRFKRSHPVKRVKLPSGSTLYRTEWLDGVLEQFVEEPEAGIDRVVEEIFDELK
jgi:hypothetical protein